ncbi:MAG: Tat pathway signal sequence domain protein, partial [Acinetobacter johnsonii]
MTTPTGGTAEPISLKFDPAKFTEVSKAISIGEAEHQVKYRFYKAIPYVSKPVDTTYQSLNISVPVEIDGKAVDAQRAPILFANKVGGYMPSSVAEAEGIGGGAGMMGPPPGMGGGLPNKGEVASGSNAMVSQGKRISNAEIALASGYVVVEPGARGRTLQNATGEYYGVAPAAIVDLKAAVRYLKSNAGVVPGNTDWIISSGTSAGGALSS